MKLTFIGAGGARTPLVLQSILNFQDRLPLSQVSFMDTDAERLDLIRLACKPRLLHQPKFKIEWTTDAKKAIQGSDYIVTTYRPGLMESRVVDEQVPLKYGVLGQETTGPGGFAMAMRTIPATLEYVHLIQELAPDAWILNFTNPSGMVTETITRVAGFERAVGICDDPSSLVQGIADFLGVQVEQLLPEYYGLNHLGWLRAVYLDGKDKIPSILQTIRDQNIQIPYLPFGIDLLEMLGVIPNEYCYFYYYPRQSVENLLKSGVSRAQQLLPFNRELYAALKRIRDEDADPSKIDSIYSNYLNQRHETYMTLETGHRPDQHVVDERKALSETQQINQSAGGYSAVALNIIEALTQHPSVLILNVPNRGAIQGMAYDDVVEVTCHISNGVIRPLAIGTIPEDALGLMKMVKAYERLTIQAAVEGSYPLALKALTLHPLVPSYETAKAILDDYIELHGEHLARLRYTRDG